MPEWRIQRLGREHDRTTFDCGHSSLNDWLRHRAGQFDRRDLARTFVAVPPDDFTVMGYYALSNHRLEYDTLPEAAAKGLPRTNLPVVLIGRLAVDRRVQGQGLGSNLLVDAFRRVLRIAEDVGVRAVEVDAIDATARDFYLKFGFQSLKDNQRHLFITTDKIRKLDLGASRQ